MGSIIKAFCECGFESDDLYTGFGFRDVKMDRYLAPAICLDCNKILVKNYKKKYSKCPSCRKKVIFYNDSRLQAESANSSQVHELSLFDDDKEFNLQKNTYLCPKCKKKTMRFLDVDCWD